MCFSYSYTDTPIYSDNILRNYALKTNQDVHIGQQKGGNRGSSFCNSKDLLSKKRSFNLPSWELTHPIPAGTFANDFPFPKVGYGLLPWRIIFTPNILPETSTNKSQPGHWMRIFLLTPQCQKMDFLALLLNRIL